MTDKLKMAKEIMAMLSEIKELEDHDDFLSRLEEVEEKVDDLQDVLDGIYTVEVELEDSSSSSAEPIVRKRPIKKTKPIIKKKIKKT